MWEEYDYRRPFKILRRRTMAELKYYFKRYLDFIIKKPKFPNNINGAKSKLASKKILKKRPREKRTSPKFLNKNHFSIKSNN